MTLTLNLARRILSIEFEIDRSLQTADMMEEEYPGITNQSDGQKLCLEMGFSNVQDFELFSASNTLKLHSQSWDILELYQENTTKPVKWNGSNIKRLLGTSLPEGEDTELTIILGLKADRFGKNLSSRP